MNGSVIMIRSGTLPTPAGSCGLAPLVLSTYTTIAGAELSSSVPKPTPSTAGLDIKSCRFTSNTLLARSSACCGSWNDCDSNSEPGLVQLIPTKVRFEPSAPLIFVMTSPIGFPIVVELLPAKRRATGCGQAPVVRISDPESPPALKVVLLITTWFV